MDTETLLRTKLEEWNVDLSNADRTLWSSVQAYNDGYMNMYALDVDEDRTFRIYRVFPGGDQAHLSVDLEISSKALATAKRGDLKFDNGERGDFTEWRNAIKDELGGDFAFVWANEGEPYLSFVGRTVRLDTGERLVCGQCERIDKGIKVTVDFDRELGQVISPSPKPATAFDARFA
ncbi:hypothetical protein HFN89_02365 [Rhizobium laguerreae]|nr:hypothetical protein [Rhizobium laguerreae]